MGFKSKLSYRYSTTHENRIWNKLVDELKGYYTNKDEDLYLIGNLVADGRELDALIIKEDAIVVIDFKDYGGQLTVSENKPWTASGININSDRKNPYAQLSENKYAILNLLKSKLPTGYENWINIGHINALVLFHQSITYDTGRLNFDLSQSASRWFNICDIHNIIRTLNEITSRETSLKGERIEIVLESLGVEDILRVEEEKPLANERQSVDLKLKETTPPIENVLVTKSESLALRDHPDFAEFYYSRARSMDAIRLVIIGQDPYPQNSNGVAFCKNSYYELFQENCSGGIILKSLGLDKEKARAISPKNPKELFYELLTSCGICFINIFNQVSKDMSAEETDAAAKEAREFNTLIIKKALKIILLGKSKTKDIFDEYYPNIICDHVLIHPSPHAKVHNQDEWSKTWATQKLAAIERDAIDTRLKANLNTIDSINIDNHQHSATNQHPNNLNVILNVDRHKAPLIDETDQIKLIKFPVKQFLNSDLINRKGEDLKIQKIFGPPGTGKTSFLINLVTEHIAEGGDPERIAYVSFTNAATNEARLRVSEKFPDLGAISFPHFCTLHSLATSANGARGMKLMQEEHFKKFDRTITCEVEWLKQGDPSSIVVRPKHPVLDNYFLSLARCEDYSGFGTDSRVSSSMEDSLVEFFANAKSRAEISTDLSYFARSYIRHYLDFKKSNNLADFNDVIINNLSEESQARLPALDLLIIDEAQDLSDLQWSLARRLMVNAERSVVAGDDDQAIMISFGASNFAFLDLPGTEHALGQSYRVPKEVSDYVNSGVGKHLTKLTKRKEKQWLPAGHSGTLIASKSTEHVDANGHTKVSKRDVTIEEFFEFIKRTKHEEWLIMAPTRLTGKEISTGLEAEGIPHFYRNIPVAEANDQTRIHIRTIHTSKGLGADNVAIIAKRSGDIFMLTSDVKLAYVALTRAKKLLLPRVVTKGLVAYLRHSRRSNDSSLAAKYDSFFPAS